MRWNGLGLLILFLLAGTSAWLLDQLELAPLGEAQPPGHEPDFYMEHFVTTAMNASGEPQHRVEAEYMAHFPDTDSSELRRPYIVLYRTGGAEMRVKSGRAWLSSDQSEIRMHDGVKVWRTEQGEATGFELTGMQLTVFPVREYAESSRPVQIRSPDSEWRGVGLEADLRTGKFRLLSQVRSRYEPR